MQGIYCPSLGSAGGGVRLLPRFPGLALLSPHAAAEVHPDRPQPGDPGAGAAPRAADPGPVLPGPGAGHGQGGGGADGGDSELRELVPAPHVHLPSVPPAQPLYQGAQAHVDSLDHLPSREHHPGTFMTTKARAKIGFNKTF